MSTNLKDSLLEIFQDNPGKKLLSVYMTAGFPCLEDTIHDMRALTRSGIDFLEIGMPFSDPLADGPVIQQSSTKALQNGMSLDVLFEQLTAFNGVMPVPSLLMGYLNPVLHFGLEAFCQKARAVGISGVILPDLPMREYLQDYREVFENQGLHFIFLITPTTPESRIRQIDEVSTAFIYVVGSSSTTGNQHSDHGREAYLKRILDMNLKTPLVVGFGISDATSLQQAWGYAKGAITGTAYVGRRMEGLSPDKAISELFHQLGLKPRSLPDHQTQTPATETTVKAFNPLTSKLFIP